MKTVMTRFAALCFIFPASLALGGESDNGGEAQWLTDHAQASKAAKETGKLILTDLFTEWCVFCKKLENETYPAPEVQEVLRKFVLLKINPEVDAFGKMLMHKAGAKGYPATVVTDGGWNLVKFISGFRPAKEYREDLSKVLESYPRYNELKPKIQRGEASSGEMYEFLKAAWALDRRQDVKEWGPRALEMDNMKNLGDVAFWTASSFGPGSEEFDVFRGKLLEYDPKNETGHFDELTLASANSMLSDIKTMEDMKEKIGKAKEILEKRLALEDLPLHPEKGQILLARLGDLHYMKGKGDVAKARELFRRAVELAPETDLAKQISGLLDKLQEKE